MTPDQSFYAGVCVALAAIRDHDQPTMFEDILRTVDRDGLLAHARRYGQMGFTGLDVFVRTNGLSTVRRRVYHLPCAEVPAGVAVEEGDCEGDDDANR